MIIKCFACKWHETVENEIEGERKAYEHLMTCKNHPLAQQVRDLQKQLDEYNALLETALQGMKDKRKKKESVK